MSAAAEAVARAMSRAGRDKAPRVFLSAYHAGELHGASIVETRSLFVGAWSGPDHPTRHLDADVWVSYFESFGPHNSAGRLIDPVVRDGMVLYRGASRTEQRRGYGMSWTTDRDVARRFASFYRPAADPAVFTMTVPADLILADYRDGAQRDEGEVVVDTLVRRRVAELVSVAERVTPPPPSPPVGLSELNAMFAAAASMGGAR